MYFCQIFGLSKLLTRRENVSQKGITRQEFGSQKGVTGQELGSQILLPDRNWALKHHYQTGDPNSRLVMIFVSQIPVR